MTCLNTDTPPRLRMTPNNLSPDTSKLNADQTCRACAKLLPSLKPGEICTTCEAEAIQCLTDALTDDNLGGLVRTTKGIHRASRPEKTHAIHIVIFLIESNFLLSPASLTISDKGLKTLADHA